MKFRLLIPVLAFSILSCSGPKEDYPSNSMDAGREFIRASMDGDFDKAGKLLMNEPENLQLFDSFKRYYERLTEEEKTNYRKASYEINSFRELNDSSVTINYSNSYMNKPMDILVVRRNGKWMIDFKYTYSDYDSTSAKP